MLRTYAERGIAMASRPSLHPSVSVTLRYCGHIVWVSSKQLQTVIVRLGSSLSAACNSINLVQREHPQMSDGIGVWYGKTDCSDFKSTKAVISLKRGHTERKLLLSVYKVIYEVPVGAKMRDLEWP